MSIQTISGAVEDLGSYCQRGYVLFVWSLFCFSLLTYNSPESVLLCSSSCIIFHFSYDSNPDRRMNSYSPAIKMSSAGEQCES